MTLFGWDASHFDGALSRAALDRARGEGVTFFTHKVAEGLQDTEGTMDDTALAAARDAGIPFVGAYLIPRSNATPAAQVAEWVRLLNAGEPWWRDFPGFFVQIDLERWSYDSVPASVGIDCGNRLQDALGRVALMYASRSQYGDQLTGWNGPLWNADYRGGPSYPGDGWVTADKGAVAGWAPYSGRAPKILQFTSSATIAGLTTCDANAFRGSVADFAAMIGGKAMASEWHDTTGVDPAARITQGGPDIAGQQRDYILARACAAAEQGNAKLDRLLAAQAAPVVDTHALATDVAQQLVAANTNGLTDADLSAVRSVVVEVLNAKLQAAAGA